MKKTKQKQSLVKELESILDDLKLWARANQIAKNEAIDSKKFFKHSERIFAVAHALKMITRDEERISVIKDRKIKRLEIELQHSKKTTR